MDIRERERGDRGKSLPERLAPTYSKNLSPIWGCYETRELLAPVPCRHLPGALEKCRIVGRVAFASNRWEIFEGAGICVEANWTVMIYASRPELGDPSHLLFLPEHLSSAPS